MKALIIRHAQNDSEFRGKVLMSIEISDESKEDIVSDMMADQGFPCSVVEESDKYEDGSSLVYMVGSDEVVYFRKAWKEVKKSI